MICRFYPKLSCFEISDSSYTLEVIGKWLCIYEYHIFELGANIYRNCYIEVKDQTSDHFFLQQIEPILLNFDLTKTYFIFYIYIEIS